MISEDQVSVDTPDREIVLTRVFNAPRELVWKAFTEQEHLANWWGPQGFTTTTKHRECVAGGTWRFVMHGPDGRDYENKITYLEVKAPERLSYKHGGEVDCEPVNFQVTVQFEAIGDKTRLTMRSLFPSNKSRDFVISEYNAVEGGKQTLGRLAGYLESMQHPSDSDKPFVYTRVLNVPRDLVWKAWTEKTHLMNWFGPKGVTMSQCSLDLREGGLFHYCMQTPDGGQMWGRWVFKVITPPERLETIVAFSDKSGAVTRAPFNPDWPLETLSIATFVEHAGIGHGTVVTLEWSALNATAAERKAFAEGHASMKEGWSGTFDQLESYLAKPGLA